jgi:hypothetical protein
MGIIRLSDEEVFTTDGQEYEILTDAAKRIKGVDGGIVEIGTRRGGSAKLIIDALEQNGDTNRAMFCIDPYGNIEYECTNLNITAHRLNAPIEGDPEAKDKTGKVRLDYDNNMRNRVIPSLYYYAYMRGLNFTFFQLEDTEFMNRYSFGVPIYEHVKKMVTHYALVFFDGPHVHPIIDNEVDFFGTRVNTGSVFVFDDIWMYDHARVEKRLDELGFEKITAGNVKASYVKK